MLTSIGRFQNGKQLFKRWLFYSTANCAESNTEENKELNDNLILDLKTSKLVKVAILGLPNAGKSTLINALVHRTICPTSSKAHTTTYNAEAVYTEGDTQIVFIDTPGLISNYEMKKFKLSETFKKHPITSILDADVIGLLQDASNIYNRHKWTHYVIDNLNNKKQNTSLILIFNKIDKLKCKKILLELTNQLTKNKNIPKFDDIFMISALTGDGVNDLRNYLLDCATQNQWKYEQDLFTNQLPTSIVKQMVKAKLLDHFPHSIPYKIEVDVEYYDVKEDNNISCVVLLKCPQKYMKHTLLQKGGENMKLLALNVEKELQNAFRTNICVRLIVLAYSKEHNCYI